MLRLCYLYRNNLTGPLPGAWSGMAALQKLDLSMSGLTGGGQWVGALGVWVDGARRGVAWEGGVYGKQGSPAATPSATATLAHQPWSQPLMLVLLLGSLPADDRGGADTSVWPGCCPDDCWFHVWSQRWVVLRSSEVDKPGTCSATVAGLQVMHDHSLQ
jgi:hypothetical protein